MNGIQQLITELKTKLSINAREDLDRLIASPEAQHILKRDEDVELTKRRALVDQLAEIPEKFAQRLSDAEKLVPPAAERLNLAEIELASAKKGRVQHEALVLPEKTVY